MAKSPAWQRKAGKNPKGGLNAAGRASAKAQGMNLKPPVKKAEAKRSPKSAARKKLTPAQKSAAKARAKAAGRPYPNLVDNAAVARKTKKK